MIAAEGGGILVLPAATGPTAVPQPRLSCGALIAQNTGLARSSAAKGSGASDERIESRTETGSLDAHMIVAAGDGGAGGSAGTAARGSP